MAVRVCVLIAVLAGVTLGQHARFASDEALWRQAVLMNHSSPRPTFNLALALRQEGRTAEALAWLAETVRRAEHQPHEDEFRARVRVQIMAIEMTGVQVCDSALWQPYC